MDVIDLTDDNRSLYFVCLEDWSDEMTEAGDHKKIWYDKMKDRGLCVKLAVDDNGEVGGLIQYMPIEYSLAEGKDLYFINCIWVHGHKKGRGNFQKRGMGQALLEAAEADIKSKGAKGVAAWGLALPFWMRAAWFKKRGYKKADRQNIQMLLWKAFDDNALAPRWVKQVKKPAKQPGKVTVTGFIQGWCPAQNIVYERAKKAAAEFGDKAEFVTIDTSNRNTFLEWGIADAIFIDGKKVRMGPPPTFEKIRNLIAKRVDKL